MVHIPCWRRSRYTWHLLRRIDAPLGSRLVCPYSISQCERMCEALDSAFQETNCPWGWYRGAGLAFVFPRVIDMPREPEVEPVEQWSFVPIHLRSTVEAGRTEATYCWPVKLGGRSVSTATVILPSSLTLNPFSSWRYPGWAMAFAACRTLWPVPAGNGESC